jgi:hypothetical protein
MRPYVPGLFFDTVYRRKIATPSELVLGCAGGHDRGCLGRKIIRRVKLIVELSGAN